MTHTQHKYNAMPFDEKARLLAARLHDKQADEPIGLILRGRSAATDAMLIATAKTQRHAQALADAVTELAREQNLEVLGVEGYKAGQWVLMDLNDVLVHIFTGDMRRLFNLEGLWLQVPRMDLALPDSSRPAAPESAQSTQDTQDAQDADA
ncbi:ribosome silencing factor [Megalodesulfovibrio gigas]|uniref:Ribosomal silencing factor RsfS n=1 Tax=Megalodesulfovibrio gigas (strain ATCC 19364 / DSM 1382 / NCIMB 9332 / VKM B-1759) TaxID=1121448 RepID=T2GFT8_MEGG1|nr:ribosome silencing factor [Megalodesulfovibrio gigas]AGW15168.1 putative iojap family protein [Megalodesulfovibrio gigas DSM 1382 = ATCC 19364]